MEMGATTQTADVDAIQQLTTSPSVHYGRTDVSQLCTCWQMCTVLASPRR